jgi:signal transduction histidine kinase
VHSEYSESSDCPECSEKKENSEEAAATESTVILRQGLQTIHRRSHGLLEFMKNYRKVALVAQPVLAKMSAAQLIEPLMPLFVSTERITYRYQLAHPDTLLLIDRTQMEQVLINLLKNATEACAQTPNAVVALTDSIDTASDYYRLHVTDNGPGILPEVQEKIFIPFFTTKPQGSGIGLALSKQIVHMHHGSLRVVSQEGCTSFTLELVAK